MMISLAAAASGYSCSYTKALWRLSQSPAVTYRNLTTAKPARLFSQCARDPRRDEGTGGITMNLTLAPKVARHVLAAFVAGGAFAVSAEPVDLERNPHFKRDATSSPTLVDGLGGHREPGASSLVVRFRESTSVPKARERATALIKSVGNKGFALPGGAQYQFDFEFAPSQEALTATLTALRRDPTVLWAEVKFKRVEMGDALQAEVKETTQYLIVKEKLESTTDDGNGNQASELAGRLGRILGQTLTPHRRLWNGSHVVRLPKRMTVSAANSLARRLNESGVVEYAEVDTTAHPAFVPNDPLFNSQWSLAAPTSGNEGSANLGQAWDVTQGTNTIVVAVLDTGITSHPDLDSKIVAGYDFISDPVAAGDANARDVDPSDVGDSCSGRASSWHGTHVAGIIAAATNNGSGIAGVAPNVRIQPVRVLGRCGGLLQDIAEAIVWAAGGSIPGVPNNAMPAKVINLSLGGIGACPVTYQDAINQAIALGAVVVVAAGNDAASASQYRPASCAGVVTVAASTRFGDYANYSNFGAVTLSAPGGQTANVAPWGSDGGILSTLNSGTIAPGASIYGVMQGTSQASPHVAGVAALIRSAFPGYGPSTVKDILISSARQFPLWTECALYGGCGAGLLDAYMAVTDRTSLYLLFEGNGTITINPGGSSCTSDCAFYVPYDANPAYTLTATPAGGYVFLGWAGDCAGTSPCSYTPNRAKTILARFAPAGSVVPITITKSGSGSGTVSSSPSGINCGSACAYNFASGSSVTLYAVADSKSNFAGWSGACAGTSIACTVSLNGAKSVSATFTTLDDYPDAASLAVAIAPTSSTAGSLYSGTDQDWFKVTFPTKGRWAIGTLGTTDTVGAVFAADGVTLYGSNDDANGSYNFELLFTVPSPQTVLVRVTGYRDLAVQTTGPYTLQSVFVATYGVAVSRSGSGSGTVTSSVAGITCGSTCAAEFPSGSALTLTAVPDSGSVFLGWQGGCAGLGTCPLTMDGEKAVTAIFSTAPAGLSLSPATIAFGGQSMGTTSPPQSVSLINNTGATVTIASVSVSAQFGQTSTCPATLATGQGCLINVTFNPAIAAGTLNSTTTPLGSLVVTTNQGDRTASLSGVGEKSLVTHYYRSILRRAPDAGGANYWAGEAQRLKNIGANVNEAWFALAQFFYGSAEYTAFNRDAAGFVTDLYTTFFNRAPDAGGLGYWVSQINSGMPREVVLTGFMFSNEFVTFAQGIFGNTAARAEVDTVMDFYRGLLSRTPDQGGFDNWVAQFRAAQCAGAAAVFAKVEDISSSFANGGEYLARGRTNAQYVGDLYNSFLRRGGDLGGVQFWIGQLATQSRAYVRQQFIASSEFQGRVSNITAQGCLP
jgi:serine protease